MSASVEIIRFAEPFVKFGINPQPGLLPACRGIAPAATSHDPRHHDFAIVKKPSEKM
jgi:hypothetical protein